LFKDGQKNHSLSYSTF